MGNDELALELPDTVSDLNPTTFMKMVGTVALKVTVEVRLTPVFVTTAAVGGVFKVNRFALGLGLPGL